MALETVAYVSDARRGLGVRDLKAILRRAREKNFRLGVTGFLVFDGVRFVQLLEGPPEALAALLETIAADDRHEGLRVLCREAVAERAFGDSPLGCVNLVAPASPAAAELRGLMRALADGPCIDLPAVQGFFRTFADGGSREDLARLVL